MKTAIIGSHGLGKTDTVYLLASYLQRFGRIDIVSEVARPLAERGMPINENTTYETQLAIQLAQRTEELVAESRVKQGKTTHIITDRSVIDNYVYAENKFPERSQKELHHFMIGWLLSHPYDKIFRIPLWNADEIIVSDHVRSTNKAFQASIDEKLTVLVNKLQTEIGLKVFNIPKEYYLLPYPEQAKSFAKYFQDIFGYRTAHPIAD